MEIFCQNVPKQIKDKHVRKELSPLLAEFSIFTFHFRRLRQGQIVLTICDEHKAQRLLDKYGEGLNQHQRRPKPLTLCGSTIRLSRSRHNPPEALLLRSLEKEEQDRINGQLISPVKKVDQERRKSFAITSVSCGSWDYHQNQPVFKMYHHTDGTGDVVFGTNTLRLKIADDFIRHIIVEFDYFNIISPIYSASSPKPSLTFTSDTAPRFYESSLVDEMLKLSLNASGPSKKRLSHLGNGHEAVAGTCFTYRCALQDPRDLLLVQNLSHDTHVPKCANWVHRSVSPVQPYDEQLRKFYSTLRKQRFPYSIHFQLQMLVLNGALPISTVAGLLAPIHQLRLRHEDSLTALALQKLAKKVEYANPDVDEDDVSVTAVVGCLSEIIESTSVDYLSAPRDNQLLIYRAMVTPAGMYLFGPTMETMNRVLRMYREHSDSFLRVEFLDESGEPLRFDPRASLDKIYRSRFKSVLTEGISIAGRLFEFLGFSHSSLRSQSCWFVAPFTQDGEIHDAHTIIPRLGYFEQIRSPAKCAARIGQTFSDTMTSIEVDEKAIYVAKDIERKGRIFSDGVGTMSTSMMRHIWKGYPINAKIMPTVFQVRIAGAKGMISHDSSKANMQLMLRESMVKFQTPLPPLIEICGAGIKPLPFFLNRQMIKILEDLGVPAASFLALQAKEVALLRSTSQSARQAATFLTQSHVADSFRLPWLVRTLDGLGLRYSNNTFLRHVVELAVLVKLRDLKYRARIRVNDAITLYGIMDETGFLKEGQIYCPVIREGGKREVLEGGNVIITRSPALHPGDIQLVSAVEVPKDSPLRDLHNCVVFSKHGARDLPSKLSGGDLDGDLYNIIYDGTLRPTTRIAAPADYTKEPERLLDRVVERHDIIDFFLTFMQQDQLGRIATLHQIIADQEPSGTFHPNCLLLAELHSTAVDFSKTGKPVDLSRIPKCKPYRPDFMVPGPRVKVADDISLLDDGSDLDERDEDERLKLQYYRSDRVLGQLYRKIDEKKFLRELQAPADSSVDIVEGLWRYIQIETRGFQWKHHVEAGKQAKEIYEDNLLDLMYQFSATPKKTHITESEVVIGTIMGEGHKQTSRQRESSKSMRDEFERLVQFTTAMILGTASGEGETLERSIACFSVAINAKRSTKDTVVQLYSFTWISAVVCLQEVQKLQQVTAFA